MASGRIDLSLFGLFPAICMNRFQFALYILLLIGPCGFSRSAGLPVKAKPADGWKLVWADEFDKDGAPNPENWKFETGFVRNNEFQWYQPDNARCENGLLIVEPVENKNPIQLISRLAPAGKQPVPTINYTSSSMHTRGLHSWQYGRFECGAASTPAPVSGLLSGRWV